MVLTKTECLFKGLPIKDYDPWTVDEERYLTGLITDKMPGGRGIESTINWSLVATQMNTDAPIYHLSMRKYTAKIVKDHYCAVIGPRAHVEEQKEKRDKLVHDAVACIIAEHDATKPEQEQNREIPKRQHTRSL